MASERTSDLRGLEKNDVVIELEELRLLRSHKTYDLYRVACRLAQASDIVRVALVVKDDCVFVGEVAPLIKHSLHIAFAKLASATFSRVLDDADERSKTNQASWVFGLASVRRRAARKGFEVEFRFRGCRKAKGRLIVARDADQDPWTVVQNARVSAHAILLSACVQTRSWKLSYEDLQEL